MRLRLLFVLLLISGASLPHPAAAQRQDFVRVEDRGFTIGGEPYHFIGVNFWFGMNLGAEHESADRERLVRELDRLEALGVTNLRIMASSEGPHTEIWRVVPAVQERPGEYDEAILRGLDFFLAEMALRNMRGVLVLNNFFMWSGGMAQYVSWVTGDPIPYPERDGNTWDDFQNFSARFYALEEAQLLFEEYVRTLIERTNHITGAAYRDDPTIMSWQLSNEPRGFGYSEEYVTWVDRTGSFIKRYAPNQLVSLGGEGKLDRRTPGTFTQFERVSRSPYLDYLTIHIWIENWGWYDPQNPEDTFNLSVGRTMGYLADHLAIAEAVGKPLVLEEFGVSRDGRDYAPDAPVTYRDRYFETVFEALHFLAVEGTPIAGGNVWSWSGEGQPAEAGAFWTVGDPFTGDPPHEHQGWYGIYNEDASTLDIIGRYARLMATVGRE